MSESSTVRCRSAYLTALLTALAWPYSNAGAQAPESAVQTTVLAGDGVDVYLSEDALQALYGRPLDIGDVDDVDVRVGFFLNEARDLIGIGDASVDVIDPDRRRRWGLRVGPRVFAALLSVDDEGQDVFSIGLGGTASFYFDTNRTASVSLTAYYAPDIVTFGSADNVTDVSLQFETLLTERMRIYVGYRVFEIDLPMLNLPTLTRDVDKGLHLGLRGRFQ